MVSRSKKVATLLLVLFTTLAGSMGVLAAPVPMADAANSTRPVSASFAQEVNAPVPDAPFARDLYLPTISSDRPRLETLEVSIVRLDQANAQSQSKSEQVDNSQATTDSVLPAPPPGAELFPAQPDLDGNGTNDTQAAATVEPSSTQSPNATSATVILLQEDFDNTFPTGSWRVLDHDGAMNGEYYWDDDDFRALNGKSSAWVANGGINGLDPAFYNYPNNMQTWMIYGPFDLSDASAAHLAFSYWNLSEIDYDFLGWYASPNGNDFYGMRVSGNSQGWKPVTLNLASVPAVGNLLGDSSVWIAFRFTSDANKTDRGAFIDQVRVQKEVNANCAGEFKAEYFNNKELNGNPVFTRCEKAPINQNWGASGPGNGIGNDDFSVRWTGQFDFEKANYNFVAIADDGVRVWLDNTQIINNWQDQASTPNLATRQVSAGKHTLRIEYYEHEGGALAQFRWLRSNTVVSDRQAFDTCFLPHPSEMQNWWGNSPYYEIGIYIGGSNRGCKAHNAEHLNASWIATVRQQGWNIIPTWVGPQAPCTTHNFYTMSSDPAVAFAEGRNEAGDAASAAKSLGLTTQDLGGTVIYYDLEPYPNRADCREAVKSFMAGWASRLHELGNQAGAYGAACASYMSDWVLEAPYTLDQIWPASWIYPAYNPNTTVWDVSCIDNSLWRNNQRIRQYAGDHTERWGSVSMTIDSNIARGQVAGSIPRTSGVDDLQQPWQPVHIAAMQLLGEGNGWVIAQGRLLWTTDGGATWLDRTPSELSLDVRAASFLDPNNGWLVGAGLPDAQGRSMLYVGKTADGGNTWQLRPLQEFDPIEPGSTQGAVNLSLLDASTAYVQIKLASSSNFDLRAVLQTTDGGASWNVVDEMPAVTSSLVQSHEPLWATASNLGVTATALSADGTGWAFVERGVCSGTKPPANEIATSELAETEPFDCIQYTALLSTPDGGTTWIDITPTVE